MKKRAMVCVLAVLFASTATMPLFPAGYATQATTKGLQAITKPSKDIVVSFVRPGLIAQMLVSKGDEIKEGQLIAQQDDEEERAVLAQQKLLAEDETKIKAEEIIHEQKVKDAEKMKLFGGSQYEIDQAILDEKIEAARIQIAKMEHEQAVLKYEQTRIAVEKLTLLAPIDGVIAEEFLKKGESADTGNMKAVRVVQLDPLWAEVPVPFLQARRLTKGAPAVVTLSDGTDRTGKIAVVSPVADAASDTILVRVEIPNPEKIPSGENVFVNFPSAVAGARP